MAVEFKASKATMIKALEAMKKAEYPKVQGESPDKRRQWEEHHQECIGKITSMILEGRWG